MRKLYWQCHYDGKECSKEKVNVVNGEVQEPKAFKDTGYWEVCEMCERNCSLSGHCYGWLVANAQGKENRI